MRVLLAGVFLFRVSICRGDILWRGCRVRCALFACLEILLIGLSLLKQTV